MLRDVERIEPGLIGGGDELEPLVELLGNGSIRAVDVVEEPKLHEVPLGKLTW
jgi:hypothetical protein